MKTIYKRLTALLLCAVLSLAAFLPAFGDEKSADGAVHIGSAEAFAAFSREAKRQTYSTGRTFILDKDIDLSAYPGLTVPYLDGFFEGRGHAIKCVVLCGEISDQALFRYVGPEGTIYDLTVEAEVISDGEQKHIGIIAGSNRGLITRCTSRGSIDAQSQVGGIAGYNEAEGVISECINEAKVDGKYQTGGIAGLNEGKITGCVNKGAVNNNPRIKKSGGNSDGDAVNISIPNAVTGLAADERANESGGIAGRSAGNISFCKNSAPVGYKELGSDNGGIAGRLSGCIQSCENEGVIYGRMNIGGIAGFLDPYRAVGLDRDYYSEIKGEFDDLSDAIDELSDSGRRLGNDLTDNFDDINKRLDNLRYSVRSYIDGYDSDLRSARRDIGDKLDDMEEIVDDMDYNFRFKKLKNYEQLLRADIRTITELIGQLSLALEGPDDQTMQGMMALMMKYKGMLDKLNALLPKLEALTAQLEAGKVTEAEGDSLSHESEAVLDEEATEEEVRESRESSYDGFEEEAGEWDDDTEPVRDAEESEGSPAEDEVLDEGGEPETEEESRDGGEDEEIKRERPSARADTASMDMVPLITREYKQYREAIAILDKLKTATFHAVNMGDSIAMVLERWPRIFRSFRSDLKDISDDAKEIHSISDDLMDRFEGRTDIMKADVRDQGDKLSDFVYDVNDTLRRDWNDVSDDIDTLVDRFESVRVTLRESRDDLKSIIDDKTVYVDVSESDDTNAGDGKVLYCKNSGEIYATSQAGGIVGCADIDAARDTAVDVFERLRYFDDVEEEEEEEEKDSLTHHVRAVIFECENNSDIYAKTGYAGGVIGKSKYGVVSKCGSYCDISVEDGKWAGGIAGLSKLAVYDSYFFGGVSGEAYVGGIAGNGENIAGTYSCAYMDMDDLNIKAVGAVAGKASGVVADNVFVDNGYGAVDGITKSGEAEGKTYERMVSANDLPGQFTNFKIRFMDEDKQVYCGDFGYGDLLKEEEWPDIEERPGEYYYWEDKEISPVRRNVTVHSVRRVFVPSVASAAGEDTEKSMLIFGGDFYPDTELSVSEVTGSKLDAINDVKQKVIPGTRYMLTKAYKYEVLQERPFDGIIQVRALNSKMGSNMALVLDENMNMFGSSYDTNTLKSYAAFSGEIPRHGYVVLLMFVSRSTLAVIIFVLVDALVILFLVTLFLRRKRRQRRAARLKKAKDLEEAGEAEKAEGYGNADEADVSGKAEDPGDADDHGDALEAEESGEPEPSAGEPAGE